MESMLSLEQQDELYKILIDMPSAALGDEEDKQESRVLVDIFSDIRIAVAIKKKKDKTPQELIEKLSSVFQNFIETYPYSMQLLKEMVDTLKKR